MEYEEDLLDEIAQEELNSHSSQRHVVIQLEEMATSHRHTSQQVAAEPL